MTDQSRFFSKNAPIDPVMLEPTPADIRAFVNELDDVATKIFCLDLTIPSDDLELFSRLLVGRLLQDFDATIVLADRGFRAQARSMARSTLETAFYLISACRKTPFIGKKEETPFFLDDLILAAHQRYRKNIANELVLIEETPDEIKRKLENLGAEIKVESDLRLNIDRIAEQLKLKDMYTVLYRSLSQDAHISITSLEHHLEVTAEQKISGFRIGPDYLEYVDTVLAAAAALLLGLEEFVRNSEQVAESNLIENLVEKYKRFSEQNTRVEMKKH